MDTTRARELLKASIAKHGKPSTMDVDAATDNEVISAMGYLSSRGGWLDPEERTAMRAEWDKSRG